MKNIIQKLAALANRLDQKGFVKEADGVDHIIEKIKEEEQTHKEKKPTGIDIYEIVMSPAYLYKEVGGVPGNPRWGAIKEMMKIAERAQSGDLSLGDAKNEIKLLLQNMLNVFGNIKFIDEIELVTPAYEKRKQIIEEGLRSMESGEDYFAGLRAPTRKKKKSKNRKIKTKKKKSGLDMVQSLTKVANKLDERGFVKEANEVDGLIKTASGLATLVNINI